MDFQDTFKEYNKHRNYALMKLRNWVIMKICSNEITKLRNCEIKQ